MARTGATARQVMRRIQEVTGDTPVHYVSDEDMLRIARAYHPDYPADELPLGFFHNRTNEIFIVRDLSPGGCPAGSSYGWLPSKACHAAARSTR